MIRKYLLIFTLIAMSFMLFAEEEKENDKNYGMGLGVGSVMINGNSYTRLRLMPEISFWKIGIGLDADILIDEDGNLREEDWDEGEDWLNKIYYIRYGQRGDSFYGRFGGFKSFTMGKGLVMSGYSNMLRYPEHRQLGLQLGGKLPIMNITMEGFTSNIQENDIMAGRLTIQPLTKMSLPILSNITFGGTFATDQNQMNGLLDTDGDNYPDYYDDFPDNDSKWNQVDEDMDYYKGIYTDLIGDTTGFAQWFEDYHGFEAKRNPSFDDLPEKDVTVFGLDYDLPLLEGDLFKLSHYGEFAAIQDYGTGIIFPGFYSKFLIFDMNLEFRMYQDEFTPAFFDELYEANRAIPESALDTVFVKSDYLKYRKEATGWYGKVRADLFEVLYFTVDYEDMHSKDSALDNQTFSAGLELNKTFIPKLSTASIKYIQRNEDKVLQDFKTVNTYIIGTVAYNISDNVDFVWQYKERYEDKDSNGEINGKEETITTTAMGVEIRF